MHNGSLLLAVVFGGGVGGVGGVGSTVGAVIAID